MPISVSPSYVPRGLNRVPLAVVGVGTSWATSAPTFAASGGATIAGGAVATDTLWGKGAVLDVSAVAAGTGSIVITETTSGATASIGLTQPASTYPTTDGSMAAGVAGQDLSALALPGGGWALHGTAGNSGRLGTLTLQSAGGEMMAYNPAASIAQYLAIDGGPLGFDQDLSLDILTLSPTDNTLVGILGAYDPIADTGISARYRYNGGSPQLSIIAFKAGATATLSFGGSPGTLTANTLYTLKLSIRYQSITLGIYNAAGSLISSIAATPSLGSTTAAGTANYVWQPGYAGIYVNASTATGATPTTGWRVGNLQARAGPRAVMVHVPNNGGVLSTDYTNIPGITRTANYLLCYGQRYVGTLWNNNATPSDYMLKRVPLHAPFAVPSAWANLNNFGTGETPSLIPQYGTITPGQGGICENLTIWWVPGAGPGAGRCVALWELYPPGYTPVTGTYPAINNATSASAWTSYSDDEGATWSSPADVTSQLKGANWTNCRAGPGNCNFVTRSGKLFAVIWHHFPVAVSGTVSATNGSTTVTSTASGAGVNNTSICIIGDSSKNTYKVTNVTGTAWTITPAFTGANISGAAAVTVAPGITNNTYQVRACWTTDSTGATGWTVGGDLGAASTTLSPSEVQAIQMPSGKVLAFLRDSNPSSYANPVKFVASTDDGATWTAANPTSFPFICSNITVGLLQVRGAIVFTGPNQTAGGSNTRDLLTMTCSLDGGATYAAVDAPAANVPGGTLLDGGGSGYSAMEVLPTGDIALLGISGPAGANPGSSIVLFVVPPEWAGLPTGWRYAAGHRMRRGQCS
jgi:hypothetical protein